MIMACERYTAVECLQMGLIHMVVETWEDAEVVRTFIDKDNKHGARFLSVQKAKEKIHPLTH